MRTLKIAIVIMLVSASWPASARADWFVSPFAGTTMKGQADHTSGTVGISGGWLGSGWLAAEGEAAWSPSFFEQNNFLTDRRIATVMGNAIVNLPFLSGQGVKPYVSGGLGVMQIKVAEAGGLAVVDEPHKFSGSVGGGVWGFLNQNIGLRGDVRYLRSIGDSDSGDNAFDIDVSSFDFWRATGGVVIRF